MPYLIDGHNLIPKIPGLSLKAMDDEMQLLELLQEFCRLQRKEVEVFFDNAPPGQPRVHQLGRVLARFVRQGQTADDAIRARLQRLGRAARNWTVVSSDQAVQASARSVHAHFVSSEAFTSLLLRTLNTSAQQEGDMREAPVDADEVDQWLKLFGAQDDEEQGI